MKSWITRARVLVGACADQSSLGVAGGVVDDNTAKGGEGAGMGEGEGVGLVDPVFTD